MMIKPKKVKLIHEVLDEVQAEKNQEKRVQILTQNDSFALRTILQLNFNERLKLDLPEGTPPFEADKAPDIFQPAALNKTLKKLAYCVPRANLPKINKERNFIAILESMHPKDAEILCLCKDKKLSNKYGRVNKTIMEKAYPSLL